MLTVLTPATTDDLTILATVKDELRLTTSTDDAYLERLIDEASALITEACNRSTFGVETVKQTERLTRQTECILLDRDLNPVISAVAVDGTALTASDYELDGSRLYRLSGDCRICWAAGTKVEITYQDGFVLLDGLPRSIEHACVSIVVSTYRARGRDRNVSRIQTEGVGMVAYFDMANWQGGLPPDVQAVISRWRRWVV